MLLSEKLNLSEKQQEILCDILALSSLTDGNVLLIKERKKLLTLLIERYQDGDVTTLRNSEKARNYKRQLGEPNELHGDAVKARHQFVFGHQLFTWSRLLLVRINRFLSFFNKGFLPRLFNLFGLSFGLELLIDIITIFYDVFQPILSAHEKQLTLKERILHRLKLALLDKDRLNRMTNDAIWFAINLAMFILLGPLAIIINPIINTIGCGFDVIHDGIFGWLNSTPYLELIEKIEKRIASNHLLIKEMYAHLDKIIQVQYPSTISEFEAGDIKKIKALRAAIPAKENRLISGLKNKLYDLEYENKALNKISPQAKRALVQSERNTTRLVLGACLILIGSVLMFIFPPIPAAISVFGIIGAVTVFIGGCLFRGFGPLIYQKICNACSHKNCLINSSKEKECLSDKTCLSAPNHSYREMYNKLEVNAKEKKEAKMTAYIHRQDERITKTVAHQSILPGAISVPESRILSI